MSESRAPSAQRPDWVGAVSFTAALSLLIYALIESDSHGFGAPRVLACFAAAGVLLVVFAIAEHRGEHAMFDLSLFRLPTFTGGLVAAFGISASIFSMFLYLVLYLQNTLHYSPFQTGLRLLIISGGILLTSAAAGRLTSRVPVRLLIGPGLIIVGVGLLFMRGLTASSSWTHLIPGFIIAGIGVGLVNPPLASTAVGVVQPQRAGMASGINSTFRQVGIATGIALLGTLFANRTHSVITSRLAAIPGARDHAEQVATGLQSGQLAKVLAALPASARGPVGLATKSAFVDGLDLILLVAPVIAIVSGVVALATIRQREFVQSAAPARTGH